MLAIFKNLFRIHRINMFYKWGSYWKTLVYTVGVSGAAPMPPNIIWSGKFPASDKMIWVGRYVALYTWVHLNQKNINFLLVSVKVYHFKNLCLMFDNMQINDFGPNVSHFFVSEHYFSWQQIFCLHLVSMPPWNLWGKKKHLPQHY